MIVFRQARFYLITLAIILFQNISFGQIFQEIPRKNPDLYGQDLAVGDIDNDGDNDLIFVQGNASQEHYSPILLNNGNGGFTEKFHRDIFDMWRGKVELIDLDLDGDMDVYIQGQPYFAGSQDYASFLINDGEGNFSESLVIDLGWRSVRGYTLFDADGDLDPDLLITFTNQDRALMTSLLINDQDSFRISEHQPFGAGNEEDFITGDLDGDQDIDVIARENDELIYYRNESNVQFTRLPTNQIIKNRINMGLGDLDGSLGPDLLITGQDIDGDGNTQSVLFINDGFGNIGSPLKNPFAGGSNKRFAIEDLDSDSDLDLVMIGDTTRFYFNQGNLEFSEETDPQKFNPIVVGQIALADLNGDNTMDVVAAGIGNPHQVAIHFNNGNGSFENRNEGSNLIGAWSGSVDFVDLDGDLDLDMTISGVIARTIDPLNPIIFNTYATRVYFNQGNGDYLVSEQTDIDGTDRNEQAFADIDGDGDLDWLLSGWGEQGRITLLMENDGSGEFHSKSTNIMSTSGGFANFEDLDGDDDLDLFLMGQTSRAVCGSDYCAAIYTNDGDGNFTEHQILEFGIADGRAIFLDMDTDGYKDLYITGDNFSLAYLNDGSNNYVRNLDIIIPPGFTNTTLTTDDLNNDGISDLTVLGEMDDKVYFNSYVNDGLGNFSLIKSTSVEDNPFCIFPGDINMDGHQDFILTGFNINGSQDASSLRYYTHLYLNNGADEFILDEETPLRPTSGAGVSLGDMDFDGDLDMVLMGYNERGITSIYENTTITNPGANPTKLTDIEDQFMALGDQPLIINISSNFEDMDGDELSYNATDFDEAVVSIIISGSELQIEALETGSSKVIIEANDGNGGKAFDQFSITVDEAPLSIEMAHDVRIYPTPTSDILYFEILDSNIHLESVEIIDFSGRQLLSRSFQPDQEPSLNIEMLPAGIYIVRLGVLGQSPITRKLIKSN